MSFLFLLKLHCCGVARYTDWKGNIPDSCCREVDGKVSKTFLLSYLKAS